MNLFSIPLYSQLLVVLISCFFFLRRKTTFIKLLTLLLVVTFLVELIGGYLIRIGKPSFKVYYYYTFLQYIIIFFLYKILIKDKKWLKISKLTIMLFIVLWIYVLFNESFFYNVIILGSFNVGFLVFLYLRELLLSDKIISYKRLLPFWVSVGLLVFHLPAIPFFSFWNYMKDRGLIPILQVLIVLMNVIISFGLIWSNKKVEY